METQLNSSETDVEDSEELNTEESKEEMETQLNSSETDVEDSEELNTEESKEEMETQLNSSETVEDSEELNTEEVFTENDSDVIPAEDHSDPEVDDVLRDELQEISQQLSRRHMIDEYVPDSSAPLKCLRNCRKSGHKCKDCNEYFPIVKEKNTEPEPAPEKNQSLPKKSDVTKTKKHTHKRSVREKQWRENMPCSSIDKKISRQKGDKSWNLKSNGSITTMHAEARVCTSLFHTHNHRHSCMVLSVFSDGRYVQVSGNKKLMTEYCLKAFGNPLHNGQKKKWKVCRKLNLFNRR